METYNKLIAKQKAFFLTNQTKNLPFRLNALRTLKSAIQSHEKELLHALQSDLNKSEFEAYSTEIGVVLKEISFIMDHLRLWTKPKKVKTPLTHIGSKSYIYAEPYGVALIISPWNYPFQLALAPLIGAIAAGNCAIIKPSELTPHTANAIEKIIQSTFPEEHVSVVKGGVETSTALLQEDVDYIFFTGSVPVGKIIMEAAAKKLTPITLELGGKSPCIVHDDAKIELAAKRIAWGKYINAGQTCIAPDYLYVHKNIKETFLKHLAKATRELYGDNPLKNESFTRIVNENHFKRLSGFLNNGKVYAGGKTDQATNMIEPTILTDISWADSVMQDEIFGPILPVIEYTNISEVIEGIRKQPHPLALYIFSESLALQQDIVNTLPFGGGCINDTVFHFASPYLPFGGVKTSGIGSYHGKGSFDAFSHKKSILKQTTLFDIPVRYPNVKNGLKKIKILLR
ncbi:aldehyde dehydrogenase [Bacillus sp. HMF5848]|uniref:aldehyde dehydrogenase n=1 Tax=Bacillus sp. HMF5848 TaxID=2495421 RepID=UPI000F7AB9A6|nr:aldehyde dehydrogenase [Bacillus sp. HMF5848]RSK25729.1 aldehyde dehydrogenase [Bacillus sp. HMF5848]